MTEHNGLNRIVDKVPYASANRVAIEEVSGSKIDYAGLAVLSDKLRDRLRCMGVRPGDRVGIYLLKSIDAVASIFGILKAGAVYVPVDPLAPASRNAYILHNCSVMAAIVERRFIDAFRAETQRLGPMPLLIALEDTGGGVFLDRALELKNQERCAPAAESFETRPDDLAYILYTSGSTGKPKGVMISHRNSTSFVDWCSEVFAPTWADRFSSHAPFHFDLSILDIFAPLKHGATLVLIDEESGKDPSRLARILSQCRISIWYSAPSILGLLAQYGDLRCHDFSSLRQVLFAGEIFPVKHLRLLKSFWSKPKYFNLYGPTETNVCTYYEIPNEIPEDRTQPFPIGKVCSHLKGRIVDAAGNDAEPGIEGELCIAGPSVVQGYWNLPEQTRNAFLDGMTNDRWYKTGDIVVCDADSNLVYIGRRDRMVKKRGYRVELDEIEATLYRHKTIKEAAVVALSDAEEGVQIHAFLSCCGEKRPSIIEIKRLCADNLPLYMVPDKISFRDQLPRTSTNKVDYQKLKETA